YPSDLKAVTWIRSQIMEGAPHSLSGTVAPPWDFVFPSPKGANHDICTVGLDIAKQVIQIHAVDRQGKPLIHTQLKRHQVLTFSANPPPCLIGIEGCGGAHKGTRRLSAFGQWTKPLAR
ncbi:MAG TPA: hypothetical protein VNI35_00995, partial [Nitrospira sp.]|nr:hypothetical protein [Nitrospira sp.]